MDEKLETYLHTYFGYHEFQQGQREIITDVLKGQDVLGVLPTGSGKSLCYQLPAKILPGLTIVISPLISLMIDQVKQMKAYAYKEVEALHSFQAWKDKQQILQQMNEYKLLFMSPELLQNKEIQHKMKQVTISLFVIDEAHCISQWGHDFRPDYLRLRNIFAAYQESPVLALTATASSKVQNDIEHALERVPMQKHTYSIERHNISLVVEQITEGETEKKERLITYLTKCPAPTIIYFSSRMKAEEISSYIHDKLPDRQVAYYHAGMQQEERMQIQQQFLYNQLDIICSTSAFGMGINKSNIHLVIHYHIPTQLESFVQEIGRAGRDGKPSLSVVLYRKSEKQIPLTIIQNEVPTMEEITVVCDYLQNLASQGESVPSFSEELSQKLQINEVNWRFLMFQLEYRKMMKDGVLESAPEKWEKIIEEITTFSRSHYLNKQKEVWKLINWMEGTTCLRTSLYRHFQEHVQKKEKNCCSNCGVAIHEFADSTVRKTTQNGPSKNWQDELRSLLLEGV
ncbi:MAG TPA: RecQ family ATP-dependent DNA helicase [Pseudogracilibacillus sp.]|nr:RecQ family ATP-dependent DNA helicase [Pseudogracilibacillus sp.]